MNVNKRKKTKKKNSVKNKQTYDIWCGVMWKRTLAEKRNTKKNRGRKQLTERKKKKNKRKPIK